MYWLFDTYWLHPIRTFINTKWDIKEHSEVFANCIKKWKLLLPDLFYHKLISMYIKPKIKREIQDWNPKDPSDKNLI